jgi:hypothetical protein
MAQATEKLSRQASPNAFYAEIVLDAILDASTRSLKVSFDETYASSFREAAQFGIAYAWEHYPSDKKLKRGLNVHVKVVGWQPVDTTSVLVAYVACRAVWQALGWTPLKGPIVDEAAGAVIFPKRV